MQSLHFLYKKKSINWGYTLLKPQALTPPHPKTYWQMKYENK